MLEEDRLCSPDPVSPLPAPTSHWAVFPIKGNFVQLTLAKTELRRDWQNCYSIVTLYCISSRAVLLVGKSNSLWPSHAWLSLIISKVLSCLECFACFGANLALSWCSAESIFDSFKAILCTNCKPHIHSEQFSSILLNWADVCKKSKKCQTCFYQLGSLFLQELFHIQDSTRSWLLWNKRWIQEINPECFTAFPVLAIALPALIPTRWCF